MFRDGCEFVECGINELKRKTFFFLLHFLMDYFSHYFQQFYLSVYPVESPLARNKFYQAIFKTIASVLLLLPVGITLALGCCLLSAYRSNKLRQTLVRAASTNAPEATAKVSFCIIFETIPNIKFPSPTKKSSALYGNPFRTID